MSSQEQSVTTELERTVRNRGDVMDLANDLEVPIHNMWVDVRTQQFDRSEYHPVNIEVTIEVTKE
jgi:hypothetical protein